MLSFSDTETITKSFISTRLNHSHVSIRGNLWIGERLQDSEARHLTGENGYEHITTVLASLNWLPVHFNYSQSSKQHKSSVHLWSLSPIKSSPHFEALCQGLLLVPDSRLKTTGDRALRIIIFINTHKVLGSVQGFELWPKLSASAVCFVFFAD